MDRLQLFLVDRMVRSDLFRFFVGHFAVQEIKVGRELLQEWAAQPGKAVLEEVETVCNLDAVRTFLFEGFCIGGIPVPGCQAEFFVLPEPVPQGIGPLPSSNTRRLWVTRS